MVGEKTMSQTSSSGVQWTDKRQWAQTEILFKYKKVFILRLVKLQNRLPMEAGESPSLEMLQFDWAQESWATCSAFPCSKWESWTASSPEVLSNLSYSLFVWNMNSSVFFSFLLFFFWENISIDYIILLLRISKCECCMIFKNVYQSVSL